MTAGLADLLRRNHPLTDRLPVEGLPYSTGTNFTGTATAGNAFGTLMMPGLTRAFWVESVIITSNKSNRVQVKFDSNTLGSGFPSNYTVVTNPAGPTVLPVRQLFRPTHYPSSGALGSVTIKTLIDTDATNTFIDVTAIGWQITDDFTLGAKKVLLRLGDSITGAGTGITAKANQYDWRTLNYHKDAGRSVRMVNLSMSGTTSGNFEARRASGDLDLTQIDHIDYSLSVNDAGQGIATATYKANVQAMIAWKQARYPAATMFVYGTTPLENNTSEANAVNLRQAASDAVTAANDPKVKYLNLGGAFDRTNTANYASSDPAGSHVHPSDAGHAAIWTVLKPFLDANPVLV